MEEPARDDLVRKLDRVIALLTDLPELEAAIGWDEPRLINWLRVFGDLRGSVLAGQRPEYVIYVRGLDMDGICGGEIFDAVLDIDMAIEMINEYR
jgi:hypothetical protein